MSKLPGMRSGDQDKFTTAARAKGWWIFVRATNEAALEFVGKSGFTPKPVTCKAKSADLTHRAGLVTCPYTSRESFTPGRLERAIKSWWDGFASPAADAGRSQQAAAQGPQIPAYVLPAGYEVEAKGSHAGCVRYHGKLIHADYDLFDVVDPKLPIHHIALATVDGKPAKDMISPHALEVQRIVNSLLGVDMVQHGMQSSFGSFDEECVLGFGPLGEALLFQTAKALMDFYERNFPGRTPLNLYPKAKAGESA